MSEASAAIKERLPDTPFTMPASPALLLWLNRLAFEIANRAVIEDIESYAAKEVIDGRTWWDTRPMTDPREFPPASIDMADKAIAYATGVGIARVHPERPYLLTINRQD